MLTEACTVEQVTNSILPPAPLDYKRERGSPVRGIRTLAHRQLKPYFTRPVQVALAHHTPGEILVVARVHSTHRNYYRGRRVLTSLNRPVFDLHSPTLAVRAGNSVYVPTHIHTVGIPIRYPGGGSKVSKQSNFKLLR